MSNQNSSNFAQLGLSDAVLKAVYDVGYETPSPIQAAAIAPLLAGKDILGQAQTGTGKTAAFALPVLSRLDLSINSPQVLVLTPTRELAIQVAEAFQTYARYLTGFHVLPVYGGQSYALQLRPLKRGVHAVVGTPGRVLDHLRRGTLRLDEIRTVVLDEADEMLRMGFIDDVEEVMQRAPDEAQLALFSATMPHSIRAIAKRHTTDPEEIRIEAKTATVATVSQRYWQVTGVHKLDALTRILEAEDFDAMVVFVRTKVATTELAERLEARGFSSSPLNGDMNQSTRELTIERLKSGRLDILVATDVAARGLDVDRVSHVVNYDVPYDTEAYVHRIGRTARAGRKGSAILFIAPRERRMLRSIERATGQTITPMNIPTAGDIANKRTERFKAAMTAVLNEEDLTLYEAVIESFVAEHDVPLNRIAAALACMAQGDRPLLEPRKVEKAARKEKEREQRPPRERPSREDRPARERPPKRARNDVADEMTRYRLAVGSEHGAEPKNIVGAIANEADLDSMFIGAVQIHSDHTTVDLPTGMPDDVFKHLKQVWVCGQQLKIEVLAASGEDARGQSRQDSTRKPDATPRARPKHDKPAPAKNTEPRFGDGHGPVKRPRDERRGHRGQSTPAPARANPDQGADATRNEVVDVESGVRKSARKSGPERPGKSGGKKLQSSGRKPAKLKAKKSKREKKPKRNKVAASST